MDTASPLPSFHTPKFPVLALAVLLTGVVLPMVLSSPAEAAVNPVPVLALKLDSANQNARVTESVPGMVTFTGQASIDKLPVERCIVKLDSSTDTGWVSLVSPLLVVFTSTTPQPFTCTVIVPPGTANSLYGHLVINGRAVAGGMQSTATTKGIISVDPYFRVELYSKKPIIEILPGEQAFITYWARNDGNAIDSFEVEISNLREIAARHWTVVLCGCGFPKIQPGESSPDRITAASPRDEQFKGDYYMNIVVKATSQNAKDFQQVVSQNLTLTIHVRSIMLPSLSPYLLILALSVAAAYLLRPPAGWWRRAFR